MEENIIENRLEHKFLIQHDFYHSTNGNKNNKICMCVVLILIVCQVHGIRNIKMPYGFVSLCQSNAIRYEFD